MRKTGFHAILTLLVILLVLIIIPFGSRQSAQVRQPPKSAPVRTKPANFTVLAQSNFSPVAQSSLQGVDQNTQTEPQFDVPTFLWASDAGTAQQLSRTAPDRRDQLISIARGHLSKYADRYYMAKSDLVAARASDVHDTGSGAIIVKFKQDIGGLEVFGNEINIVMNQKLQLVAISGYLTGASTSDQTTIANYHLTPEAALSAALSDLTGKAVETSSFQRSTVQTIGTVPGRARATPAGQNASDPYLHFSLGNGVAAGFAPSDQLSRTRPMIFHVPGQYIPAYYVETSVLTPKIEGNVIDLSGQPVTEEWAYSYVISADDGHVLFRKNLVAEQTSTYRVWADPVTKLPYDTPAGNSVHPKETSLPDGLQFPFVAQQDISLVAFPFSHSATDPWLALGATETNGNNADAFLNLFGPDGFGNPTTTTPTDVPTGDYRAQATGANAFQHSFTAGTLTSTAIARQAAITQMFYNVNFMHDWYYDSGFDEASGNAQVNNYGRGGLGSDSIKAQAQDFSGFANANMATPADGAQPRMRMYVFPSISNVLDVTATPTAAGKRGIGVAMLGPQSFDVTGDLVNAAFSASPTCTVTNAAALAGKIALTTFDNVDGTGCSFTTRILNLSNQTTALATVMMYTSVGTAANGAVNITGFSAALSVVNKPFASISWNGSATIRSELAAAQTVTAHLIRAPDRDGTLDNQIMFHEWGHYISNRLIGNGWGINNNLGGGLGEGWGDFNAMLLTVRADDTAVPTNTTWNGSYALATYATSGVDANGNGNNGYYYGIRRVPYSTDLTRDPLTYKHITNGQAISGAPIAFGANGASNSEVHNTGEVWATMLWECYASLLRDTQGASPRLTFAQAQDRMRRYLVASFKATPLAPTLLEARDAVIAAAFANDPVDGSLFLQAFAKRGAGFGAVSPPRYSGDNVGAVESFTVSGPAAITFVGASVNDSIVTHDSDGYLDDAETGLLTFNIKNTGQTALSATSSQVTCDNAGVTFPDGNSVNFGTIQPGGTGTASVKAHIEGQSGLQVLTFTITTGDPGVGSPVSGTFKTYAYANEVINTTKTDAAETKQTPWTATSNLSFITNEGKFSRQVQNPFGYKWFAPDVSGASDQFLTSPVMTVDGSGSVNLQFDHSFGFEFDAGGNYDGGVVEMSVNGGAFTDLGGPAYNGTLLVYTGNVNPLQGRSAFVQNSAGTIHTTLTRAVAPGSTVQVRFRAASDSSAGAAGWAIDNIALSGIVETPFSTIVADNASALPFVNVVGRVQTSTGFGISGVVVTMTDGIGNVVTSRSNSFGYFQFSQVANNQTYTFKATDRRYGFTPQTINVQNAIANLTFVPN